MLTDASFRYHPVSLAESGIPMSNSTLINGKGRYPGGPEVPLTIVNVEAGMRYVLNFWGVKRIYTTQ